MQAWRSSEPLMIRAPEPAIFESVNPLGTGGTTIITDWICSCSRKMIFEIKALEKETNLQGWIYSWTICLILWSINVGSILLNSPMISESVLGDHRVAKQSSFLRHRPASSES
jgi:hypothetical protein